VTPQEREEGRFVAPDGKPLKQIPVREFSGPLVFGDAAKNL
jgi:hypothetical protein